MILKHFLEMISNLRKSVITKVKIAQGTPLVIGVFHVGSRNLRCRPIVQNSLRDQFLQGTFVPTPNPRRDRQVSLLSVFATRVFRILFFLGLPFAWDIRPWRVLDLCTERWAWAWIPCPCFTWTQDFAFWPSVDFSVQSPLLLRACGLQPPGCSREVWFSGIFLFVFWWLGLLFYEPPLYMSKNVCLLYYLKDLLQEDFIVKFVSKLPKPDVKISPTL